MSDSAGVFWEPARNRLRRQWQLGRLRASLRLRRWLRRPMALRLRLLEEEVTLCVSAPRELRRAADFALESALVRRMRDHLREGDTIYDIGANVGLITLALAHTATGRRCTFDCFEPEPRNFAQLERNLAVNGLADRAMAHRLALGDREGQARLFVRGTAGEGRHSIASSRGATGTIDVPLTTVATFALLTSRPPEVLKIDVEGAEGHVLAGLRALLPKRAPRDIFLEVHRKGLGERMPDGSDLHAWLSQHGYRLAWSRPRRSGTHRHYCID